MKPLKPKRKRGPEHIIQDQIINMLRIKCWFAKSTHGNIYQSGFPDIFATHARYGPRWIEVKLPNMVGSHFEASQLEVFPQLCANGSGVWVLTAATEEEYLKLFKPSNWHFYLDVWRSR